MTHKELLLGAVIELTSSLRGVQAESIHLH